MQPFWQPYVNKYGNLTPCTLSIEHCDASAQSDTPLTAAQKQASFALVAHLCQKYGIPADHIKPHNSICATACPGTYPMAELINFIARGGNTLNIPQSWHDDGKTLTAPNGHHVVLGFRDHVLNYPGGWSAGNQPMEEETHADPLEYSNPGLGAGQRQSFTWTTLEYTTARGVFEAWQGQELVALRALLAKTPGGKPVDTAAIIAALKTLQTYSDTTIQNSLKALVASYLNFNLFARSGV